MRPPKTEKCFLRASDGSYTEITCDDLLRLEDYRSRFFLPLEGGLLEVPEDVFRQFNKMNRRERYLQEEAKRVGGVLSLDTETAAEQPLHEILADANMHVEQDAVNDLMLAQLREALAALPEDERDLIQALYFDGKTERESAAELGVSRSTLHEQKAKILRELRKFMEN